MSSVVMSWLRAGANEDLTDHDVSAMPCTEVASYTVGVRYKLQTKITFGFTLPIFVTSH